MTRAWPTLHGQADATRCVVVRVVAIAPGRLADALMPAPRSAICHAVQQVGEQAVTAGGGRFTYQEFPVAGQLGCGRWGYETAAPSPNTENLSPSTHLLTPVA
jgi:hypothetical protein